MKEYMFIRDELTDSIRKQDTLSDLIITILGISAIWEQNNAFLLMTVLLVSAVLLARIIHYRNVVYYLSSYLAYKEKYQPSCRGISWENNVSRFKKKLFKRSGKSLKKNAFIWFVFKIAGLAKNLGNIVLSAIIFAKLISDINFSSLSIPTCLILGISTLSLLGTVIFTVIISIDKRIKPEYNKTWYAVLKKKPTKKLLRSTLANNKEK